MYIEVISFGISTALFLILGLVMLTGQRDNLPKTMLAVASLASAVWSGAVTYLAAYGSSLNSSFLLETTLLLELFRSLAWFAFLLVMLRTAYKSSDQVNKNFKITFAGLSIFILGLMLLVLYRVAGGSFFELIAGNDVLIGHLLISIGGIVIIEQLYRNTSEEHRWALKYLWIGIGGMFAYDFYLYSDAFLFQRIDNELWNARGFIHAMVVPLIAVAIKREMRWSIGDDSIDIFLSRRMVFHTTTLLGAGAYLIFIGFGGYYVRDMGGEWGAVAQATFLFAAVMILAVLLFSGRIRARLKVGIDKHFFHYKYDYREEWLRIIRTLSSHDKSIRLHERAIRALAQIIDSPGGLLVMERENGCFESDERWNYRSISVREPADSAFIKFLSEQQFVISLDEYNNDPDMYTRLGPLEIPEWISGNKDAWLVVPLMLQDHMMGFVVLLRSPAHERYFNWEDSDLLKTAGRQAASHLAQYDAAQALVSAKRFEEVNRLSAFIVHDVKNMVGQLSMVVSNAAKHKSNPMFIDDAIITVENSVNKMNKLLVRLRGGGESDGYGPVGLCALLEDSIRNCTKAGTLPIPVLNCLNQNVQVTADKDRMSANIAHIIQNAQDATNEKDSITVRLSKQGNFAIIEVEDTGEGMDEAFIHDRLFQPFESTKGTMGIGVFQVREYVHKLGGQLDVESQIGQGTIFRLHIPLSQSQETTSHPQVVHLNEHEKRKR
ncbi:MAG: PEP-CTERM system histidine kinase PrsK [endosymbiont of Galathealinum brachiosum]|uniref:histidine kinase n=1 Tax=endosymbiont of Galathealinum brachiosum TaxID=2200906 RepID=A0A370D7V5_9GAMM|nr:MAG: PEP-CTERM system histidine kinase PrsK [endosymbiont of Galathealinum brachiosum]